MRAVRLALLLIPAALLCSASVNAACLPGTSGKCINFDTLPQISQQVAGKDSATAAAKKAAASSPDAPYTGLTVGVAPNVRRAPTVGYRWSFD